MNQMIRHHTDTADARARECKPKTELATIAKAPSNEAALGLAMQKLARKEGHTGKTPRSWDETYVHGRSGVEAQDVTETMFTVMGKWITPMEIAAKVSAILGRDIKVKLVSDRLHSNKSKRFVSKLKTGRQRYWKMAK